MKFIPLTQGKVAFVDDADYPMVSKYRWHVNRVGNRWYAMRNVYDNGSRTKLRMHNVILQVSARKEVDHKNHDGLDNRRVNLRAASRSDNNANGRQKIGRSGYRGVWPSGRRWAAHIQRDGKRHYLGMFKTAEEAALTWNEAARWIHGEFAILNTIQPQEPEA